MQPISVVRFEINRWPVHAFDSPADMNQTPSAHLLNLTEKVAAHGFLWFTECIVLIDHFTKVFLPFYRGHYFEFPIPPYCGLHSAMQCK